MRETDIRAGSHSSAIVQFLIFLLRVCFVLAVFKAQRLVCGIVSLTSVEACRVHELELLVLSKVTSFAFFSLML